MCSSFVYPVFVYGTLLRGLHNHHYLDGAERICDGYIYGRLWDLGSFPALEKVDNCGMVLGEVYAIDAEIQKRLDKLENYDPVTRKGSYLRRTHTVISLAGPRLLADVYTGNMDLGRATLIDTGRFTSYMAWRECKGRGEVA